MEGDRGWEPGRTGGRRGWENGGGEAGAEIKEAIQKSFRSNVVKDCINQPQYFSKWQQKLCSWKTFLDPMIPLPKQRPEN